MKYFKPSFSKIQRDFLETFIRYFENEFKGQQVALAEKIGCDQSQISRWTKMESAPPEYACRLLLKELGGGTFKKSLGRRLLFLREKIFGVSLREFASAIKLDSIAQLEAVEQGDAEPPRQTFEMLIKDYQVSASYLDYGEGGFFNELSDDVILIKAYLRIGFELYVVTPPKLHPDRLELKCRLVLHRPKDHLPQCVVISTPGNFRHITGAGRLVLENAMRTMIEAFRAKPCEAPRTVMVDDRGWKDLQKSCFYRKNMLAAPACIDEVCESKVKLIFQSVLKKFTADKY